MNWLYEFWKTMMNIQPYLTLNFLSYPLISEPPLAHLWSFQDKRYWRLAPYPNSHVLIVARDPCWHSADNTQRFIVKAFMHALLYLEIRQGTVLLYDERYYHLALNTLYCSNGRILQMSREIVTVHLITSLVIRFASTSSSSYTVSDADAGNCIGLNASSSSSPHENSSEVNSI